MNHIIMISAHNPRDFVVGLCIFLCIGILLCLRFSISEFSKSEQPYDEYTIYTIEEIDAMSGQQFEVMCAELLEQKGMRTNLTPPSGDFGIDIIATDQSDKIGIQCKCFSGNVGVKAVQEAYSGAMYYDCSKAIVMTNSYFTKPAIEMANSLGVKLWNRADLIAMLRDTA